MKIPFQDWRGWGGRSAASTLLEHPLPLHLGAGRFNKVAAQVAASALTAMMVMVERSWRRGTVAKIATGENAE